MRTVVFVELLSVANAINKDWSADENKKFYAVIFLASIAMDVIEFIGW